MRVDGASGRVPPAFNGFPGDQAMKRRPLPIISLGKGGEKESSSRGRHPDMIRARSRHIRFRGHHIPARELMSRTPGRPGGVSRETDPGGNGGRAGGSATPVIKLPFREDLTDAA